MSIQLDSESIDLKKKCGCHDTRKQRFLPLSAGFGPHTESCENALLLWGFQRKMPHCLWAQQLLGNRRSIPCATGAKGLTLKNLTSCRQTYYSRGQPIHAKSTVRRKPSKPCEGLLILGHAAAE